MSAQKTSQPSTSQANSRGEQKGQQQGVLARRSSSSALPSLWSDPFDSLVNPFSLIRRMQEDLNRAFGQSSSSSSDLSTAVWAPAIEVAQQNGNLVISAELPGLTENDVTVEVKDDVLVIQGERKFETEETEGGIRRSERRYGQFYRAIALPDGVDPDQVQAEFQNGVLRIVVPMPQQAQSSSRQIPIQTAGQSQAQTTGSSQSQSPQSQAGQSSTKSETPAEKAA